MTWVYPLVEDRNPHTCPCVICPNRKNIDAGCRVQVPLILQQGVCWQDIRAIVIRYEAVGIRVAEHRPNRVGKQDMQRLSWLKN